MTILGIETSCDETAAAIVEDGKILLSNVVASSQKIHQRYGGIVPEIAARKQVEYITPVVKEALINIPKEKIDAIAVTSGPGLVGSLLVGVEFAKTLSYLWQKPIIPVNHLVGHIYANFINQKTTVLFPALVLIVSGGHTELVLMKNHGVFENIGGTRDDAAGEAFDKAARLLNLGYPGGPAIQKAAEKGNPKAFNLPRPLLNSGDYDFSFSGLKTALFQMVKNSESEINQNKSISNLKIENSAFGDISSLEEQTNCKLKIYDLAASFQQAVIDCLIHKTLMATQNYQVKSFLLAGGVAANLALRHSLEESIKANHPTLQFFVPSLEFCTDNAAAIASAAFFNFHPIPWQKIKVNPGLNI